MVKFKQNVFNGIIFWVTAWIMFSWLLFVKSEWLSTNPTSWLWDSSSLYTNWNDTLTKEKWNALVEKVQSPFNYQLWHKEITNWLTVNTTNTELTLSTITINLTKNAKVKVTYLGTQQALSNASHIRYYFAVDWVVTKKRVHVSHASYSRHTIGNIIDVYDLSAWSHTIDIRVNWHGSTWNSYVCTSSSWYQEHVNCDLIVEAYYE